MTVTILDTEVVYTCQTEQEFALAHGFTEPLHQHLFTSRYAQVLHAITVWRRRYDEVVRDWYEHGDGRPTRLGGRGWAYPECIHGTSHWTDWDNICGGCEDPRTDLEQAADQAADDVHVYLTRARAWMEFRLAVGFNQIPEDLAQALLAFTVETISDVEVR